MFVYFIQKKGFLDGDISYLKNRLIQVRETQGDGKFHTFYRAFLLELFHGGLATPKDRRDEETVRLIGSIPYLNGGLFEPHALEADGNEIQIADEAFEAVFNFFDQYEWTLDTRAIERADGREINPDVLGHIFEKYINQKQMGAYYTKEDITDYITKNTVVPWLFQNAAALDKIAFEPGGYVWRLLSENPDTYIFKSIAHGVNKPLPENIEAGIDDVTKRVDWNKAASSDFGLPTEIWRETIARRQRYAEVKSKVEAGEISVIEDLITYNLDIRQFAQDIIQYAESPDVVRAFWKGISAIKVLDPACGSGAFLFAALGILFDLYDACLERMEQFVSAAPLSGGGRAQLYSDFRQVLEQVASHPNRPYFIYKSIIIANLYGVDIMDEAVEICKLRLFLKLAAQLESVDQIEPLPDIDFNIRAGNSLIGYTSFADVKRATEASGFDFEDRVGKIEATAQDLDKAFQLFRQQQTDLRGVVEVEHKSELRIRLAALGFQLDQYLAKDYGIEGGDGLVSNAAFNNWKEAHKPFHWLVEFFGIIKDGGFDAIIGNPPYIEIKDIKSYGLKGFQSIDCGNIYAPFIERGFSLLASIGKSGYIVPISSISTDRYEKLRDILSDYCMHISLFDDRPSRLFDGLEHIRLSIMISGNAASKRPVVFTTKFNRWSSQERDHLFRTLLFEASVCRDSKPPIPKLGSYEAGQIYRKLQKSGKRISESIKRRGKGKVFYTRKVGHFLQFLLDSPIIIDADGDYRQPSELKTIFFETEEEALIALCVYNSSLFYWHFVANSDCRNVNKREVVNFPIDFEALVNSQQGMTLTRLGSELSESLQEKSESKKMRFSGAILDIQCFYPKLSKDIIDQIDTTLSDFYDFSANELDYLINYDIKFRAGATTDDNAPEN